MKLTFYCFYVSCVKYFWPREAMSPVLFMEKCGYSGLFVDTM